MTKVKQDIAVFIEERSVWTGTGYNHYPSYYYCKADTVLEQSKCINYRASTSEEKAKFCHPSEEGSCFYAECGCSDNCSYQRAKKK